MNGHLSLSFEYRGNQTVMTHNQSTLPLRASNPIHLDEDDALCVMLLNPTGGLLGGDSLVTDINLGQAAHVVLTTPSASKVYRTDTDSAVHQTTINVAQSGVVEYIPDHVIPHPGSSFSQSLVVNLELGSSAIIFDGFSVGRIARAERWLFKGFATNLEVNVSGKLVCRDRIKIQPNTWIPSGLGGLEDSNYTGTMLVCAGRDLDWQEMTNNIARLLSETCNAVGAASTLAGGGCLVRYHTETAHSLNETNKALWAVARRSLLGKQPVELRKQ
jgi:urease accessory protein